MLRQAPPFPYGERAILALPKALRQASFHKGMERPIPTLLKALGQAPPFPYEERAIPALLNALGQALFIREQRDLSQRI